MNKVTPPHQRVLQPTPFILHTTPTYIAITSVPTTIIALEIINWPTYTNTTYGFSFKYPPNWKLDPGDFVPDQNSLLFIVTGGNAKKDAIRIELDIKANDKNYTPNQWFSDIITQNNSSEQKYSRITISGYPSLVTTEKDVAYEQDDIIAPVKNLSTKIGRYEVYISNVGEMQTNPYSLSDSFLQQQFTNFHRVLTTFSFPK